MATDCATSSTVRPYRAIEGDVERGKASDLLDLDVGSTLDAAQHLGHFSG